jgi:hypothetical protein
VILLPTVTGVVWYASYRVSNASAVCRLEAKVRQRGEPVTLEELAARYSPIPDEENAAILLLETWEKDEPQFWKAVRDGVYPLPEKVPRRIDPDVPFIGRNARRIPRAHRLSEANRTAAEEYLREHSAHMDAVRLALQRPRSRFPVQFTNGFDVLLPHLEELRAEAKSFQIESLVAAERGEKGAAIEALRNVVRTSKTLSEEPCLISQLVRIGCVSMAINGSEHLLSRQQLSDSELRELQSLFENARITNGLPLALAGERAMALSIFDRPPAWWTDSSSSDDDETKSPETMRRNYNAGMQFLKVIGLTDPDKRLMLETLEKAIAFAEDDRPDSLSQSEVFFKRVHDQGLGFPPRIFSSLLLPPLERAATRFASLEAYRRAAVTALAVERYRLIHHGRLSDEPGQLVPQFLPAIALDPFDGRPLRVHPWTNGFVVYSVGADRKDDNGRERPARSSAKNFDQTFIVER